MRSIYYNIIDFKEIHPIRFWILLIGVLLLFIMLVYLLKKGLLKYKKKSIRDIEMSHFNPGVKNKSDKNSSGFIGKTKALIGVIIGQFIIIIVLCVTFYNSKNSRVEDPSISSSEYTFGIDVSHYQGIINWNEMRTSRHPIEFVFIRSTMGVNGVDKRFAENWEKAKEHNYVRGAYHYYRPNENSTKQFENYKSQVKIKSGDFIPILDIEKESRSGRKNLKKGVLNWLKLAEKEYGAKPMIYTGLSFYQNILKGSVDGYPLWIAAYSGKRRLKKEKWTFHQFTEKVNVKGISTTVDGNDFKGEIADLKKMCKK
jgi:lysozyme